MHATEKAASKIMGAAKQIKAAVEGVTGVFKELMREHGEATALLLRIKSTSDIAMRQELFPKLRVELLSHERAELAEIYPVFREHKDLSGYAEMHEQEASALERLILRLDATPFEDVGWAAALSELAEAVSRHVKEEENKFFPAASRILGKTVTEAMTPRYEAKKESFMKEAQE
jgi:hypothetical protein